MRDDVAGPDGSALSERLVPLVEAEMAAYYEGAYIDHAVAKERLLAFAAAVREMLAGETERLRLLLQRIATYPENVTADTLIREDLLREAGPREKWKV